MDHGASLPLYVLVRVVLVPAAPGALAVVAARLAAGRARVVTRLLIIGAALGACAAHLGLAGVPSLPPVDTIEWVPLGTAAATLFLLPGVGRRADLAALLAVLAGTACLVGKPVWSQALAPAAMMWIAAIAVGGALAVDGLRWSTERLATAAALFPLVATLVGASLACAAGHSVLVAMMLGGIAANVGALAVGGLVLGARDCGRGLLGVWVVAGAALVLYARLYDGLPTSVTMLLGASLVAPVAVAALPRFRGRSILAPILAAALALGGAAVARSVAAEKEGDAMVGQDAPTSHRVVAGDEAALGQLEPHPLHHVAERRPRLGNRSGAAAPGEPRAQPIRLGRR